MSGISSDLDGWRAQRTAQLDPTALRALLARLRAWKTQHDQDRAGQLGFLRMAWDAVFGEEHEKVAEAIAEIEAALAG